MNDWKKTVWMNNLLTPPNYFIVLIKPLDILTKQEAQDIFT